MGLRITPVTSRLLRDDDVQCSGHGVCRRSVGCVCTRNWSGSSCSVFANRRTWVVCSLTGECLCQANKAHGFWSGARCVQCNRGLSSDTVSCAGFFGSDCSQWSRTKKVARVSTTRSRGIGVEVFFMCNELHGCQMQRNVTLRLPYQRVCLWGTHYGNLQQCRSHI